MPSALGLVSRHVVILKKHFNTLCLVQVLLEEEGEEVQEVQNKLERERRTRMALEERVRLLEGQLYQVLAYWMSSHSLILTLSRRARVVVEQG